MAPGGRKPLGQCLVEQGSLTTEGLARALEEQRRTGAALRDVLLKLDLVPERAILDYYEDQLGIPVMDLTTYALEPDVVRLVPERVARQFHVVPLFKIGNTITVAMADPLDFVALDEVKQSTGLQVDVVVSSAAQIREAVERHHPVTGGLDQLAKEQGLKHAVAEIANARPEEDGPIIRFVNAIVQQALRDGASDLHFEPDESSFPILHGENVVMRILDRSLALVGLEELGLFPEPLAIVARMIERPNGIVLVTGPTGSGKTTTLYSCIQRINNVERNIVTLEDPVEYHLGSIRQTQVDPDVGLTFARGL